MGCDEPVGDEEKGSTSCIQGAQSSAARSSGDAYTMVPIALLSLLTLAVASPEEAFEKYLKALDGL